MTIPALAPVKAAHLPSLGGVAFTDARRHAHAITVEAIHAELDEEAQRRDYRRDRRECRGRAGKPMHCGGCFWVLQNAAQPCPRCGFTNGYGYPR